MNSYREGVPRVTDETREIHAQLPINVQLSPSQLQRAIEAKLGPVDPTRTDEHWRCYGSMAAGRSRRFPDHDDAAIDFAIGGFPTVRLKAVVLRLLEAGTWPEARTYTTENEQSLDEAVGEVVDRRGERVHRLTPFADRLVRGARASGSIAAEGHAVSAIVAIARYGATGRLDDAELGETLEDVSADFAEALSGALDAETVQAGFRLVMAATSSEVTSRIDELSRLDVTAAMQASLTPEVAREIVSAEMRSMMAGIGEGVADPGARLLQAVEEATPEELAAAVRTALGMADLTKALGFHDAQSERERRQVAAELAPSCLVFAANAGTDWGLRAFTLRVAHATLQSA